MCVSHWASGGPSSMASFMFCSPLLRDECRRNRQGLARVVERVDAGEKQPLPPVHSAKLGMAPRDIQVRLWVGLLDDGDELRPKPRQAGAQIRPCHLLRSRDDRSLNIRWLLAAFVQGINGREIKRC